MRTLCLLPFVIIFLGLGVATPERTQAQGIQDLQITMIDHLISDIAAMDLHHGLANSLIKKLENARKAYEKGNGQAATNLLEALVNEVNAQGGKNLSLEQVSLLLDAIDALLFDPASDPLVIAFHDGLPSITNRRQLNAHLLSFVSDCLVHPYGLNVMTYVREQSLSSWYLDVDILHQEYFVTRVVEWLDPLLYW
jgi:hypothetical protein